jgi:hypothetical protein
MARSEPVVDIARLEIVCEEGTGYGVVDGDDDGILVQGLEEETAGQLVGQQGGLPRHLHLPDEPVGDQDPVADIREKEGVEALLSKMPEWSKTSEVLSPDPRR